jgi:hypothetical protein
MSDDQNAGQNYNIQTASKFFEQTSSIWEWHVTN